MRRPAREHDPDVVQNAALWRGCAPMKRTAKASGSAASSFSSVPLFRDVINAE
jgi:hypothetical protein